MILPFLDLDQKSWIYDPIEFKKFLKDLAEDMRKSPEKWNDMYRSWWVLAEISRAEVAYKKKLKEATA